MIDLNVVYNSFNNFFHSDNGNYSISLCRIFIGLVTFYIFCDMNNHKKYFSPFGYFPIGFRKGLNFYPSFFDIDIKGVSMPSVIFYIGALSSLMLTIGFLTPVFCLLTFLSLASFINRNPYCFHSGSSLLKLILFLMIFSKSGQELSIDKYLNFENLFPTFNFFEKLIQIQIAVMYIKTSWFKLNNTSWQDGAALHYVRYNKNYSKIDRYVPFDFLFSNPSFLKFGCYLVVFTEMSIGFLSLTSDFSLIAVILGFILHLTFIYFMRLRDFPYICMASLLIFIPSELIENYLNMLF